nr:hypothetical protein [Nannocystis sp.]
MVALVNDLPRRVAGDDDQAGELADEAVDRAREVAVAAVVDEDVEQDVAVEDHRERGQVPPAPRQGAGDQRLAVVHQQPGVEGEQAREVAAVVEEVEPLVPPVLDGGLGGEAEDET